MIRLDIDDEPLLRLGEFDDSRSAVVSKDELPPPGAPSSFNVPEDGIIRFREQQLWFRTIGRWATLLVCLPAGIGSIYYGVHLLQTRDERDLVRRHAYMYFALAALLLLGVAYFTLSLAGTDVYVDLNRCCVLEVRRGLGHVCRCCLSTTEVPFERLRYIGLRPYKNESHKWTSIAVGYGKNPVAGSSNLSPTGSFAFARATSGQVSLGSIFPGQGSSGSMGSGDFSGVRDKSQTLILCSWPDARHISDSELTDTAAQAWHDRNTFVSYLAQKINERGGCMRVKESV